MAAISPSVLSDRDLLAETSRVADRERRTTAELLALLAELDVRRLYLGDGYSSLFTYCTQALHFSEAAAYSRITAARAARRFPILFTLLADGDVTLTTVSLLAAHLTDDNHEALLDAARHKRKRDVEHQVAGLYPQPDISATVRRVSPGCAGAQTQAADPSLTRQSVALAGQPQIPPSTIAAFVPPPTAAPASPQTRAISGPLLPEPARRSIVAPLGGDRYLLKVTVSADARRHLDRARDLLRHTIPTGDAAAIIEKALTVLVDQLERTKFAATPRPRKAPTIGARGRHIPSAVKRAVWARDEGRCAFTGSDGRCPKTGFLEFHHVEPFAAGGPADIDNLQLRCRAHNQHEADRYFRHA
jgi:hypothetical protein